MIENILRSPSFSWLSQSNDSRCVILSKIRLSRNLAGMPFPGSAGQDQLNEAAQKVMGVFQAAESELHMNFTYVDLFSLPQADREILAEKELISPQMADHAEGRWLCINPEADAAVLLNGNDHVCIQYAGAGLCVSELMEKTERLDGRLEEKLPCAFDRQFGYLTASPRLTGTGLTASCLVYLPGIARTKLLSRLVQNIAKFGFSIHSLFGNENTSAGDLFEISNQITLGIDEHTIVSRLSDICGQIMKTEDGCRQKLKRDFGPELKDETWRAFGTLKYAQRISREEALICISALKLGADLGMIPVTDDMLFQEMVILTCPAFLRGYVRRENMDQQEEESRRADVLREKISKTDI